MRSRTPKPSRAIVGGDTPRPLLGRIDLNEPTNKPKGARRVVRTLGATASTVTQPMAALLLALQTRSYTVTRMALRTRSCHSLLRLLATGATFTKCGDKFQLDYRGSSLYLTGSDQLSFAAARDSFVRLIDDGWHAVDSPDVAEVLLNGPQSLRFVIGKEQLEEDLTGLCGRFVRHDIDVLQVKDCQVVDIGSHIGDSAVAFARQRAASVYSFEPERRTFNQTMTNVALCGHGGIVHLFHSAVGNGSSEASLSLAGMSRFEGGAFSAEARHWAEMMNVMSFNQALAKCRGDAPIVCKMDCDGHEFEIFQSADIGDCLQSIDRMVIEYHRPDYSLLLRPLHDSGFHTQVMKKGPGAGTIVATR